MACSTCKRYSNVLWHSAFRGTRLTPNQLLEVLQTYLSLNVLSRPKAGDVNRSTGFGLKAVGHVIDVCLQAESLVSQKRNCSMVMKEDVEADAHAMRRFFISSQNTSFRKLLLEKGVEPGVGAASLWQCHVRLVGLCARGGRLCVAMLPAKLVSRKALPPPESLQDCKCCVIARGELHAARYLIIHV